MKEVYVSLPLIEAPDENFNKKALYQDIGQYLVRLPNSDVLAVEVYGIPESGDNVNCASVFIGQPKLFGMEELVLKASMDAVSDDYELHITELEAKLAETQAYYESELKKKDEEYREKLGLQVELETSGIKERLLRENEQIKHDYELKTIQLENDMPKRFGQGEWISGKTLKEIIALLAKDNSQKQAITGQNGQ